MQSVWIIFTFSFSSALAQFMCPDMFGMFRHPDNCSIFFICNYGMAHERACPPDLYFDIALGICRHSSDVQCLHQTQLLTAGFTCSSSVGLFADPFSCEHFYLCANGHPYRQKCPFGLIFDGAVCNWKYDRSCRFQDRPWLRGSIKNQIKEWSKDPQRPSKIDITKIPKTSTQIMPDGSILYSTQDETTSSINNAMTEEVKGDNRQQVKFPTVTPVEREITTLEDKNITQPQESRGESTQNLQQNENLKTQSPKEQTRWKELQRQQQKRRQRQQWRIQRQRQWRLQQRWKLQQWRIHQKTQRLQEQQQKNRFLNVNFNRTTISTRLMAGKVTTMPNFTSRRPISNKSISRKWWRPSGTEQSPRSEKKTSPPLLFPVRHKTHLPALIAIQAVGFKKSLDNSKNISNNSFSKNLSVLNDNDSCKNCSINSVVQDNRNINTDNSSINNYDNAIKDGVNISKIYNNTHVINNITRNTSSNENNNSNIHINNITYNKNNTNNIINNNATNTNLTTNYLMSDINTTFLNRSNNRNINNCNKTTLQGKYDSTTDAMFVIRTSENSNEKSNFLEPFTKKETTKNLSAS